MRCSCRYKLYRGEPGKQNKRNIMCKIIFMPRNNNNKILCACLDLHTGCDI